jgi:hypothetical protein
LGDGRLQRKATKTKRNELKFAFGFGKDDKKEEKIVKELELLAEVSEPCLLESGVRSQSAAADGNGDIVAVESDAYHRLLTQKRQSPVGPHRAEGDRRTRGVLRNHLQREAVINAWQDEQSKVNPSISFFSH